MNAPSPTIAAVIDGNRLVAAVTLCILIGSPTGLGAQENAAPFVPLRIEVEGRSIESQVEVDFYGNRVPRDYFVGTESVSERLFFEAAGDRESARRARNHRALSIGIGTVSMLAFFSGLVLFGAADEVDYTLVGLSPGTDGRVLSLSLVGGSLGPALVLAVRRESWAPLDHAFSTMIEYNDADRER